MSEIAEKSEEEDKSEEEESSLSKKIKTGESFTSQISAKTIHDNPTVSLSMLQFKRVLNENSKSKMIVFEAEHDHQNAVVILEKTAFSQDNVKQILDDANSNDEQIRILKCDFHNDIYGNYFAYPSPELNYIKTTIIHPSTDKHIQKYSSQRVYMMTETPAMYYNVTLPYIESLQFSLNWVYNILDHKAEVERIVFEDLDTNNGFVLLPDMKWDGKQMNNLYLVGICRKKGIRSLRDLTSQDLTLLNNIKVFGCRAIHEKYNIAPSTLRIYIHYQPSYYHFHVHFTHLTNETPGCQVERAHLLDTVINNISLCSDYYKQATISFPVKETDELYLAYQKANQVNI